MTEFQDFYHKLKSSISILPAFKAKKFCQQAEAFIPTDRGHFCLLKLSFGHDKALFSSSPLKTFDIYSVHPTRIIAKYVTSSSTDRVKAFIPSDRGDCVMCA